MLDLDSILSYGLDTILSGGIMSEASSQKTYHVLRNGRRTTVHVDRKLSTLLSLQLNVAPGTLEAHTAVRQWIQDRIDTDNDAGRKGVSQWLQGELIEFMISDELREKYGEWIDRAG